jgi:predicted ATP-grasp superfamily ATP-dependent carboligase
MINATNNARGAAILAHPAHVDAGMEMTTEQPRILLSEGSSLSAREAITALGLAGHRVELMSSDPMCLGRFSCFVTRLHATPASGRDPDGWLTAIQEVIRERAIDVVLPVHEQAYLLAAARKRSSLDAGVALAEFSAFEEVQSKASLAGLLTRLGVPQPATMLVRSADEFAKATTYPFFVKAAFGTASTGVWRVTDEARRDALAQQLATNNAFADGVVVQQAIEGTLERTQAVFDRGRLVVCHSYRQIEEGPGGGDILKESVVDAEVTGLVATIGAALDWHGALSFDYLREGASRRPFFIDANPRLVEPMNAWLSGVDLPGALLRISLGEHAPTQAPGRAGVVTRLGLMGLLDAARKCGRRRDVLTEMVRLATGSGRYRGTREELVPLWTDPWCAVPLGFVASRLLWRPDSAARFAEKTVAAYSLTQAAIQRLRAWQHSG